jgi:hypothetical protein
VGRYLDRVALWWIAPGVALVLISFAITVGRVIFAIAFRRTNLRLGLFALRLRQIGFGLFFLGLGAGMFVRGLTSGPDIGSLVLGAVVAGTAGLYFIAASDPIFKTGVFTVPPSWRHRPRAGTTEETLEAKAERLHHLMHADDDAPSPGSGKDPV